jgi:serine phosphatase RsbU (regulator of sigma subunit)
LWILRGGELIELKPTRNPIGSYPKEVPFETETIQLLPKDRVFMFSDGYKDQFGGENFEKIKSRRFKELIIGTGNVPLAEQKNEIEQYFDVWKGENSQTDDVLLFAFEV